LGCQVPKMDELCRHLQGTLNTPPVLTAQR